MDCLKTVEHSEPVALVLPVTLLVLDSSAMDEVTFVSGSSVVIAEETVLDIEDCFHAVVWQVLVLSWVSMLELVAGRQLVLLPFDSHSSAACRVPFDEDCAESDDSLGLSAALPLLIDVDSHSMSDASTLERVDFVVPNEIVAGIVLVAEHHATILERVVEPMDSSKDVGAGATAVVADDFEVLESNEIVGFVEYREAAIQPELD